MNVVAIPVLPERPVRPIRCTEIPAILIIYICSSLITFLESDNFFQTNNVVQDISVSDVGSNHTVTFWSLSAVCSTVNMGTYNFVFGYTNLLQGH
jgi:hypothetical protein